VGSNFESRPHRSRPIDNEFKQVDHVPLLKQYVYRYWGKTGKITAYYERYGLSSECKLTVSKTQETEMRILQAITCTGTDNRN